MPDFAISTIFSAIDRVSGTFHKMARNAGIFGDKSSKAFNRAARAGTGFGNIVKGILTAGFIQRGLAMLGNGLREVKNQFIDFDQSLTEASAKFGDLNLETVEGQKTLQQLKDAARKTGAETEKTAAEAAKGLGFWAMAGATTAQAMALLPGSVDLATVSGKDLARASDIASDSLGAFGLMTKDTGQLQKNFTRLNDVMAMSMNATNMGIEELFESVKKGAPTFTAAGQSMETFQALVGTMANASVKGSEAGTILRNVMLRLSDPTKEAAGIINSLGIELRDQHGDFRDVIDIMADFETATSKMGTAEKTAALSTVFGARAVTGINIILKEGVENIRKFRSELENSGGFMKKMADIIRQSLGMRLAALNSAAIELGFQFFEVFEKKAGDAIGKFTEFLRAIPMKQIMQNFSRLFEPIGQIINVVIELGKAIFSVLLSAINAFSLGAAKNSNIIEILSGVLSFVAGVIKNVAAGIKFLAPLLGPVIAAFVAWTAIQWLWNVAMMVNPIAAIVIAITGLIAAIGWVVTNWENLVNGFKEGIGNIWNWMVSLWEKVFKPIWDGVVKLFEDILSFFGEIISGLEEFIKKFTEFITGKKTIVAEVKTEPFEKIAKEKEFIKGFKGIKEEKETKIFERTAPNEAELEARRAMEMRGRIEFIGAPEGTKAEFKMKGSPPIELEGLGPNR